MDRGIEDWLLKIDEWWLLPVARYSILDTGYWMLDAQYSILVTRYSMLDARHPLLFAGYPAFGEPFLVPSLPRRSWKRRRVPLDIVFLDLLVESSASNFELPGRFPQIPVCLLQYLLDQSFFCNWKRVGREVKDKTLSKGKVSWYFRICLHFTLKHKW